MAATIELCSGCRKPKPQEWCWDGREYGCPSGKPPKNPGVRKITCPVCHRTSYNENDIEAGYCGNCHAYTAGAASFTEDQIRAAMSRHYPEILMAFGEIVCHCARRGEKPFTVDHLLEVLRVGPAL